MVDRALAAETVPLNERKPAGSSFDAFEKDVLRSLTVARIMPATVLAERVGGSGQSTMFRVKVALIRQEYAPAQDSGAIAGVLGIEIRLRPSRDPASKGVVEWMNGFFRRGFIPGWHFTDPRGFDDQLDRWMPSATADLDTITVTANADKDIEYYARELRIKAAKFLGHQTLEDFSFEHQPGTGFSLIRRPVGWPASTRLITAGNSLSSWPSSATTSSWSLTNSAIFLSTRTAGTSSSS
jgi:hypothetical protein